MYSVGYYVQMIQCWSMNKLRIHFCLFFTCILKKLARQLLNVSDSILVYRFSCFEVQAWIHLGFRNTG